MKKLFFYLLSIALSTGISTRAFSQTTIVKYLSGTDKDHTVPWDFFCTGGRNSGKWTKIAVPSDWELQGFGNYNYGHDKVKSNEQGIYKRTFRTEPAWRNKRIFIVFEGSMTDTRVEINGKQAGPVHQGSFYRFKYDITDLLRANAANLLEVTVSKTSANASVNNAERGNSDFWLFGGIYRPVYLEIVPSAFIDRIAIDAKADGSFHMDVYPEGLKGDETIEAQVETLGGEKVGTPFSAKAEAAGAGGALAGGPLAGGALASGASAGLAPVVLTSRFTNPILWNSEFPHLYRVVVSLKDRRRIIHQVSKRFGFRTVELRKGDGFYVNGVKILFKGCDRHSFWPETGRTLSHGVDLMDVRLMKEMNMNAVRMSHYPPDQDFLDVCDSLGLYVLDELTGWQAAYDTVVGHKLIKEMVIRDVNHPSVVIWDNGNEGGWNRGLDNDYSWYDPQNRIVIHPFERFNGTNTKHYPDYAYVLHSVAQEKDVFFPTEFMHGLYDGGAGAGLDDYWNLMMKHPHGAGGFIWAFLDEGVLRTDKMGTANKDSVYDTDGNHAPDGIVGPHREKEGSFYTIKEIWSPVYVDPPTLEGGFDGRLKVENRYFFTDLSQCVFRWRLVSFPGPAQPGTQARITASGRPSPIEVLPGKSGVLDLRLPADWAKSDALYLTAYGPDKKEIFTWSWAIKGPAEINKAARAARAEAAGGRMEAGGRRAGTTRVIGPAGPHLGTEADERGDTLIVRCDGVQYYFDRKTGFIGQVVTPGRTVSLSGGPVLAGVATTLTSFHWTPGKDVCTVTADYGGAGTLHVQWTFAPGNPAKLDYAYTQTGPADFMGITFNYPEDQVTGMKWLGRGPYHVWKNRLKGQLFGVWSKKYNNSVTGETWQYPEFKGYHAEVNWAVIDNREAPFTIYLDNKDMYLQMLRPQRAKDSPSNNNVDPPFPAGGIGILNAISPIGDKFHAANVLGPQSQKTIADGKPVSGTVWLDFGG